MRNKTAKKPAPTQEANVIYQHNCTAEDCGPHSSIGMTKTTLSRRLTCHLQNRSIKEHYHGKHQTKLTRRPLLSFVTSTSLLVPPQHNYLLSTSDALRMKYPASKLVICRMLTA
ncbi:hypothetical protein E2C01_089604 [Portunus trituberculatus]|uniref:Uncharacterized protein n=1 Tax=Portunus trituberculatus TaxID=210409 RepID=A0A5B7JIP9_PORTR|nr:hypothetical protein [Portunus trituberculatus]